MKADVFIDCPRCGPILVEGLDPDLIDLFRAQKDPLPCPHCKTEMDTGTAYKKERGHREKGDPEV